jgi:hypothetical protein
MLVVTALKIKSATDISQPAISTVHDSHLGQTKVRKFDVPHRCYKKTAREIQLVQ